MIHIADQIEAYLLERRTWVPAAEICARFDVTPRQLRNDGSTPGLCTTFAVSGDKGFKHVSHATPAEYLRFKHRLRRHAIAELVRVRNLDRRRHSVTRATRRFTYERDTGQGVLLP